MKQLIFSIIFLIASTTLFAYDAEIDGIYYNFSGDEAEVTFQKRGEDQFPLSDYSGSIVIPEHVVYKEKSYNVTSIGMQAFRGCSGLTSINIPESVISIGGGAFLGCSSLNTINVGPNVERIYREVFDGTPWYYNLPDGMVYVGKVAYKYKGEMPKGTHYSIKEGTSSISEDAFMGCCGLTSITIPESVTCLEERVFEGCVNLVSVNLPESMTSIGGYAFSHCSSLSSINIPKGVTKIGSNAFWFCSSLTSFTIPEESMGIEKGVFANCSSLTAVVIPESVIYIEWFGFSGCSNLSTIVCNAKRPPSVGEFGFSGVDKQNCKLYVPQGSEEVYKKNEDWKDFYIVEMGTGISEMKNDRMKSEKYDDAIYDLSGRRIANGQQPKAKGLYIVDGKRVAVK